MLTILYVITYEAILAKDYEFNHVTYKANKPYTFHMLSVTDDMEDLEDDMYSDMDKRFTSLKGDFLLNDEVLYVSMPKVINSLMVQV
ncbi:hypothetical protein D0T84_16230 [Dysgonomonas sp. 521]|uniref:hypothetical protein n=1 Tax=Dysgonomonas sp. 521 TaxID=2302932 RepID=UPI0013D6048C|nr:hypothetical protein [Dysgonomonas sp. 521]NDV96449.1 hypothetical protein [Dysgonomonas sp. 521]